MNNQRPEWMIEAAKAVIEAEDEGALFRSIRAEMEATEGRRAGTDRDATRKTYEALADVIAKHAPAQDQVVGPGDVVQMVPGCSVDPCEITIVKPSNFGESDFVALSTSGVCSWRPCHKSHLIRIGRAKYWPDGSPVEGGGK